MPNLYKSVFFFFFLSILTKSNAQENLADFGVKTYGYYQTINLDAETPCHCNEKTQRTYDLAKGLLPNEVVNYQLHAYTFSFGDNTTPASKLIKAIENDSTVYKISMKEWSAFMLLTTKDFDAASFEKAGKLAFTTFATILPEDFLKIKNTTSYNEYMEYMRALQEAKLQQQNQSKN